MERIPRPQLQLRSWFLPVLVGLLLVLHLTAPYRGWQILLVGLGGIWLVGYLWTRSLARGLRLTRELRFGWVHVGDFVQERFTLTNDGRWPALWIEVMDHSTMPDCQTSQATGVGGRNSTRWHTQALCTRRGLFTVGPTSLRTGGPFGLYTVALQYPESLPLLVLPPVLPLPAIEVAPAGRAGEGRPRTNALERTVSAAGVREYHPGDSLHRIHWRSSARRDALYVHVFDGTPASDWWILLDMNECVQAGVGSDATDEHAVILAASLADRGLAAGYAVGLAVHGNDLVWLPPQKGQKQRFDVLEALALVSRGACSLDELLACVQPTLGQYTSLVIITPTTDSTWIESLVPLLRRGVTPTVLLLNPASFGGTGDLSATRALLTDLGVAHYVIGHDLLGQPEAHFVQEARRARWMRQARETPWRALAR